MSMVFFTVLSLSITGSVLTLLLFALKPVYKKGFSKVWQYYIWLIVLARLLIPFSPDTNLFSMVFKDTPAFAYEGRPVPALPSEQSADTASNKPDVIPQDVVEPEPVDIPSNSPVSFTAQVWLKYAGYLWAAGALGLFVWKLSSYLRLVRHLQRGSKFCSDPRVASYMDAICASMKISPAPVVYISEAVPTPMLIGIWRQSMILPNDALGKDDLKHVLQHELVHYRRYDILYKWLAQIVACVHWFNPLVYLVRHEISRNCELACDEVIIRGADDQERRDYGEAIIAAIKPETAPLAHSGISVSMSENTKDIKERLDAIMKFKNTPRIVALLSILIAAVMMCGAAYAGSYKTPAAGVELQPKATAAEQITENRSEQSVDTPPVTQSVKPTEPQGDILNSTDAALINEREWSVDGITSIEATYATDRVSILPSTNGNIILREYLSQNSISYHATTEVSEGTLKIRLGSRPTVSYVSRVEIYVPESMIGTVKASTTSGKIEVNGYNGSLDIITTSGKIEVLNGSVGGNISSSSGAVEISLSGLAGNLQAVSSSGKVTANLPQTIAFSLSATSNSGKVVNNFSDTFATTAKSVTGSWGTNPSNTINLQSSTSTVTINVN